MNTYKVFVKGIEEPFIVDAETDIDAVEQVKVLNNLESMSGDVEIFEG
jgi:hypothetical protein